MGSRGEGAGECGRGKNGIRTFEILRESAAVGFSAVEGHGAGPKELEGEEPIGSGAVPIVIGGGAWAAVGGGAWGGARFRNRNTDHHRHHHHHHVQHHHVHQRNISACTYHLFRTR